MDDLVGLAVIAMLVIAAGALCGLIALIQLNGLKQEIAVLRAKVTKLQASKVVPFNNVQGEVKDPDPEPQAMAINTEPTLAIQSAPIGAVKQKPAAPKKAKPATPSFITTLFEKLRTGFEQNWMTWIGAIALAFGGIFLAKYSLEAGLLSPLTRLSLGGVFGLSLIAVASYLHYKRIIFEGFNNYIPAALASGGLLHALH